MISRFDEAPKNAFVETFKPSPGVPYQVYVLDWEQKAEFSFHYFEAKDGSPGGMYLCDSGVCCAVVGPPNSSMKIPILVYTNPDYEPDKFQLMTWNIPFVLHKNMIEVKKKLSLQGDNMAWHDLLVTAEKQGQGTRQNYSILPRSLLFDRVSEQARNEAFASVPVFWSVIETTSYRKVAPGGWPAIFEKHKIPMNATQGLPMLNRNPQGQPPQLGAGPAVPQGWQSPPPQPQGYGQPQQQFAPPPPQPQFAPPPQQQQGGYPPQQGYQPPPAQPAPPPPQQSYPPQGGYPPQQQPPAQVQQPPPPPQQQQPPAQPVPSPQGGYPPPQGGYPPQQQQGGYSPPPPQQAQPPQQFAPPPPQQQFAPPPQQFVPPPPPQQQQFAPPPQQPQGEMRSVGPTLDHPMGMGPQVTAFQTVEVPADELEALIDSDFPGQTRQQ